jgi:alkaline phosphatase D
VDFPLGVASGDVTTSGAVLWTRYLGNESLKLKLLLDDALVFEAPAPIASGGFVHFELTDLDPGVRYDYEFAEMDGTSETGQTLAGSFVSAPAAGALPVVRLGAGSCVRNDLAPRTLNDAATRSLDAFLLLGDSSYNDDAAQSLTGYRSFWGENIGKVEFRRLRADTSVLATWDDHEAINNWDAESISPGLLSIARQTFFEHMPIRRSPDDPDRIWRSVKWGRTLEVFLLDCRGERLPSEGQYLSPEQMAWLKDGLESSDAVFKVIGHSVPISENAEPDDVEDSWLGYESDREEILGHIRDREIGGVLWVAGDAHYGGLCRVETSGPGSDQIEVIAGPLAQSPNLLGTIQTLLHPNQFDWSASTNNYAELEFRPTTGEVQIVMRSEAGAALTQQTYAIG